MGFLPPLSYTQILICAAPILLLYCAFFAYRVNRQREPDDPEKREISFVAVLMAPLTPFFLFAKLITLIPSSIMFGIFLVIFPFLMLLLKPLPGSGLITKLMLKVGDFLLKVNMSLLRDLGFTPA